MGVPTGPARGVLRPQVSSTSTAELPERVYVPHSHCEGSRAPAEPSPYWAACSETRVGSGRPQTATLARQRFTFCLATRRSSLSLAVDASAGADVVDTSETMEGGTSR
jgi:hypothetical protein